MPENEDNPTPSSWPRAASYILAMVIACLAGVGATNWYLRRASSPSAQPPAINEVLHLDDFVVNLADTDNRAFAKIGLDIGQHSRPGNQSEVLPSPVPAMRDAILTVVARYRSDELLTPAGKAKLKSELLRAVQERVPWANAAEIYFTEFLVQR